MRVCPRIGIKEFNKSGLGLFGWLLIISLQLGLLACGSDAQVPPLPGTQPRSQYGTLGLGVQFSVSANGSPPLSYQWQFSGTDLAGATQSTLQLTNLHWADAGIYRAVITNKYGSLISSNATLGVGPLAFWGLWQNYIRTNPPLDLTNISMVAASDSFCLALKPDGTLAAWGVENSGVIAGSAGVTNVSSIAVGQAHCLALTADGLVVAWGSNSSGQTNVPKGLTNVVEIAAGGSCSMALQSNGTVLVWGGQSFYGQTNVPSGLKAVAIGAGQSFCAALMASGQVVAWGSNSQVQTAVPPGLSNVVSLSVGQYHTMALQADGTIATWGYSNPAQTNIPPQATNVVAIAAGWDFDLALRRDGSIVAWGGSSFNPSPNNVPVDLANVFSIAAGRSCAFAVRNNGEPYITVHPSTQVVWAKTPTTLFSLAVGTEPLRCQWQRNGIDIPGATNSNLILSSPPIEDAANYSVQYSNGLGVVTSKVATLTVRPQLTISTWGNPGGDYAPAAPGLSNLVGIAGELALRDDGQLVRWTTNYGTRPSPPAGLSNVISIAAGEGSYLALKADGHAVFWAGPGFSFSFTNNFSLGWQSFTAVAAGGYVNLALRPDGTVYQWSDSIFPSIQMPAGLAGVTAIAAGERHCLALKSDGTVTAWGWYGSTPANAPAGLSNVTAIACGYDHAIALRADGTVTAWGGMGRGETNVPPGLSNVIAIAAGGFNNLALRADGSLVGWGYYGWSNVPSDLKGVRALPLSGAMNVALTAERSPCVSGQPHGPTTPPGTTARFSVWNSGEPPLGYQWFREGKALVNETNQMLMLQNLQAADAGQYAVVVTNSFGATTSSWATVTAGPIMSWPVVTGIWVEPAPPGLTDPIGISCGSYHCMALRADGTLTGWNEPWAAAPSGLNDVTSLASGQEFTIALRSDGTAFVLADDANQYDTNIPTGLRDLKAVAAGMYHALALKSDGTVASWFLLRNMFDSGQTNVPAGLSNVVAIAGGDGYSLALKADGTVVSWGSTTNVPVGLTNVVAIAAGFLHNLALKSDGTVLTWGWGSYGLSNPPSDLTNVVSIGTGAYADMACRSDGSLAIWGDYTYNGGEVPAGLANVYAVSGGFNQIVALTGNGRPVVTVHPFDQSASAGHDLSFTVMAAGAQPLRYQWRFNGNDLPDATNSILRLSGVAVSAQGAYRCIITNSLGSVISASANLSVTAAPFRFDIAGGGIQFTNGVVRLSLTGLSGTGVIVLLSSTNLLDWVPVYTNAPSQGTWEYLDTMPNAPARFYRALERGP